MFFNRRRKARGERNARRFKRRPTSSVQPFDIALQIPGAEPLRGRCVDLSAGGCAARFHLAQDPNLAIGDALDLMVDTVARSRGLEATARVAHVRPDGDGVVYGFEFIDSPGLIERLKRFFTSFLNRNLERPIEPGPLDEIPVLLWWEGDGFETTIQSISTTNLVVMLCEEGASRLQNITHLFVEFELPDDDAVLNGPATVAHRTWEDAGWRVELKFDPDPQSGLIAQGRLIENYVFRRGERRMTSPAYSRG